MVQPGFRQTDDIEQAKLRFNKINLVCNTLDIIMDYRIFAFHV